MVDQAYVFKLLLKTTWIFIVIKVHKKFLIAVCWQSRRQEKTEWRKKSPPVSEGQEETAMTER